MLRAHRGSSGNVLASQLLTGQSPRLLLIGVMCATIGSADLGRAQDAPIGGQPAGTEPAPVAPSSSATPSDEAQMNTLDDEARKRFELGRTFYEAGRFREAAEEFAEAYRLSERPQLLYNLYVANRDAGKWAEATEALRGYLEKVPDAPDRITLRARLSSMEAQQAQQAQQLAQQRERDAQAEADRQRAAEQSQPAPQRSVVPWVMMGSGAALLVGSLVTGVLASKKANHLDDVCTDSGTLCPESARDDVKSLRRLAVSTDVLWAVGGAALVTGVVLRLTGALDGPKERPVTASIEPTRGGLTSSLTVRY